MGRYPRHHHHLPPQPAAPPDRSQILHMLDWKQVTHYLSHRTKPDWSNSERGIKPTLWFYKLHGCSKRTQSCSSEGLSWIHFYLIIASEALSFNCSTSSLCIHTVSPQPLRWSFSLCCVVPESLALTRSCFLQAETFQRGLLLWTCFWARHRYKISFALETLTWNSNTCYIWKPFLCFLILQSSHLFFHLTVFWCPV